MLSLITPKGTSLRDLTYFELFRVKMHQKVLPVGESKKVQKRYISPVCPEAQSLWIVPNLVQGSSHGRYQCAKFFVTNGSGV